MQVRHAIRRAGLGLVLPLAQAAGQSDAPAMPSAGSARALIAELVADPRIPGIAAGRLEGADRLVMTAGRLRADDPAPVTAETVFEIGSITKAFTGLLLADMVLRGEVGLDDPVAEHLPPGTRVPERDGVAITLRHLATHSSGLPRLPSNLEPEDWDDPYADYDSTRLVSFLAGHQLVRPPGTAYLYSNLGAGLLGWALATRAGQSYEGLLRERVLDPLGMRDTRIALPETLRGRFATGHDAMGEPAAPWNLNVFVSAGGLRSTLSDMLRFAAAAIDTVHGPLAPAMALSEREAFGVNESVGLGWHRLTRGGRTYVWHNGGTGGFRSMLVVDPAAGRASVVLANSTHSLDAVGIRLLDADAAVPALPLRRATVKVDRATLAKYPGVYRLAPAFAITITPRGRTGLYLQATGQQRLRLYPSSATDFFVVEVDASVTFEIDEAGNVVALVLHQGGVDRRAPRDP